MLNLLSLMYLAQDASKIMKWRTFLVLHVRRLMKGRAAHKNNNNLHDGNARDLANAALEILQSD